LVIDEPETLALKRHLAGDPAIATSPLAVVEVTRATTVANASARLAAEARRVLESCLFVEISDALLRDAAAIASPEVRTLDAIHLASALQVEPDEFVVYDRRLARAAEARGLVVTSPGAG
jgi:predicted nucleic acid-binding protein